MEADRESQPAREPARRPARPRRGNHPPAPAKVKLQLTLDPATKRWLELHALADDLTVSALVEAIVKELPTRHYMTSRSPRTGLAIADVGQAEAV